MSDEIRSLLLRRCVVVRRGRRLVVPGANALQPAGERRRVPGVVGAEGGELGPEPERSEGRGAIQGHHRRP